MSDRPGTERSVLRVCAAAVPLLLAIACASPPQKEMDQADGAIATARAAGAPQYASEDFAAAEAALRRSHEAVEQRDYRQALNHALDARERAQTAAREAADKKAVARGEAERAITAAELALAAAQQLLPPASTRGPRRPTSPSAATAKALRSAVDAVSTDLQEARSHMQAQRFGEALEAAAPLPERIREATSAYTSAADDARSPRTGRRGR